MDDTRGAHLTDADHPGVYRDPVVPYWTVDPLGIGKFARAVPLLDLPGRFPSLFEPVTPATPRAPQRRKRPEKVL